MQVYVRVRSIYLLIYQCVFRGSCLFVFLFLFWREHYFFSFVFHLVVCIPLAHKAIWIRSAFLHLFLMLPMYVISNFLLFSTMYLLCIYCSIWNFVRFTLQCRHETFTQFVLCVFFLLSLKFYTSSFSITLFLMDIYVHIIVCIYVYAVVWEMGNISWKTITKTRYERRFIKKQREKKK